MNRKRCSRLAGILALSSCLSLSAISVSAQINTETLSEVLSPTSSSRYYFGGNTDYLDVLRMVQEGTTSGLSTSLPDFSESQSDYLLSLADNRAVVHQILDAVTPQNASSDDTVMGIYNFFIYNFIRNDTDRETLPTTNKVTYDKDRVSAYDRGTYLLYSGTGGCLEFSSALNRLLNTAGFPAFEVYGEYVNRDGSQLFHGFNRAQIDGTWQWYDVDVEGSVYRRGGYSSPLYYLYKKDSAYWEGNHNWDAEEVANLEAEFATGDYYTGGDILEYEIPTSVQINGITFSPKNPLLNYVDFDTYAMTESVMLLPMEEVMRFLGAGLTWNGATSMLECRIGSRLVEMPLNSQRYWDAGNPCQSVLPIRAINGVDYISVEDLCFIFGFGYNVNFFQENGAVQQVVRLQGDYVVEENHATAGTGTGTGTGTTGGTGTGTGSTGGAVEESDEITYSTWAEPHVNAADENNLLVNSLGKNYTTEITRLQIADLLVNLIETRCNTTLPSASLGTFYDTADGAVLKAYEAGLITGRGAGAFAPDDLAQRQEIAIMLLRTIEKMEELEQKTLINHQEAVLAVYNDFATVASYAQNSLGILVNNGLMSGSTDASGIGKVLNPVNNTSIQEALILINNLFQL